jgi:hypothetical protein
LTGSRLLPKGNLIMENYDFTIQTLGPATIPSPLVLSRIAGDLMARSGNFPQGKGLSRKSRAEGENLL